MLGRAERRGGVGGAVNTNSLGWDALSFAMTRETYSCMRIHPLGGTRAPTQPPMTLRRREGVRQLPPATYCARAGLFQLKTRHTPPGPRINAKSPVVVQNYYVLPESIMPQPTPTYQSRTFPHCLRRMIRAIDTFRPPFLGLSGYRGCGDLQEHYCTFIYEIHGIFTLQSTSATKADYVMQRNS